MISTIVTAYNVGQTLYACIQSIEQNTLPPDEVIIVLDKPTDGTEAVALRCADEWDNVRIVRNAENMGAGLSRRIGIETATSEWVSLVDGDDVILPTMYRDLMDAATEADADVATGDVVLTDENLNMIDGYNSYLLQVTYSWMNSSIYRRDLLLRAKYSALRYTEDSATIGKLAILHPVRVMVHKDCYLYRQNATSLCHTSSEAKRAYYHALCGIEVYEFAKAHGTADEIIQAYNIADILTDKAQAYTDDPDYGDLIKQIKIN